MAKVMIRKTPLYIGYDVFIIAGQSNNSGRGTYQTYTQTGDYSSLLFANDYTYKTMVDPIDSNVGQVDTVSSEAGLGSVYPIIATGLSAISKKTIFVPCAKGGTGIVSWLPGANHFDRATLYGSMAYRARKVMQDGGTLRSVLFWQGETDAVNQMEESTYNGHIDTFANSVYADLGIKVMQCKLQNCSGIDDAYESAINTAIGTAWSDNANMLTGPDFSDIGSDDAYHFQTSDKLTTAGSRWLASIKTAFSWS